MTEKDVVIVNWDAVIFGGGGEDTLVLRGESVEDGVWHLREGDFSWLKHLHQVGAEAVGHHRDLMIGVKQDRTVRPLVAEGVEVKTIEFVEQDGWIKLPGHTPARIDHTNRGSARCVAVNVCVGHDAPHIPPSPHTWG